MQGWIKLYRQFTEWEWYGDANTRSVFLHLLLTANVNVRKYQGYTIGRGQCIVGRKSLAEVLNISEQQVRTALEHLKNTHEITTETTNKFTIVSICNYDKYQGCADEINQQNNQEITNNQPTNNQQVTTPKEYNNIIIKEINPLPTREEILKYAEEKQINADDAISFFLHYDGINWQDGNGNKITNWRSRLELWARDNRIKRQVKQTNNGGGLYRNSSAEEWERTKNKL